MDREQRQIVLDWIKDSFYGNPFSFNSQYRNLTCEGIAFLIFKTGDYRLIAAVKQPEVKINILHLLDDQCNQNGFTEQERDYVRSFLKDGFLGLDDHDPLGDFDSMIKDKNRLFSSAWPYNRGFIKGLGTLIAGNGDYQLNYEFLKDWATVKDGKIVNLDEVKANYDVVLEKMNEQQKRD